LDIHVAGPTIESLDDLRKQWLDWLKKFEGSILGGDFRSSIAMDRSVPNLSSIMFMADENGRRVLFTGDGLGDHLIQGLKKANLLDSNRRLHVDVLKVPHHGSDRNVTDEFFRVVTADKYIISANGRDKNPSLSALGWIAESAKEQHRSIEIVVTNLTP
jgi:hypothetical protein